MVRRSLGLGCMIFVALVLLVVPSRAFNLARGVGARWPRVLVPGERLVLRATVSMAGVEAGILEPVREGDSLWEVNDIGVRRAVTWSPGRSSFVPDDATNSVLQPVFWKSVYRRVMNTFVPPEKMREDYYTYSRWRMAQRLLSSVTSVFGTQSLLMALGVKQNKLGIAAATTWVLKDALGKCSRMYSASQHGRRFDVDAKRWRFRSALLFTAGNALEIFTYIFPSLFFVTAALANALKQMAMLTSSATRNAIYKSFAKNSNNIGDITAKGEAQIAVIDLVGMFIGVTVSKCIGMSRHKITSAFLMLAAGDIFCIYKEIRSVVFNNLNYERSTMILDHFNRIADADAETAGKEKRGEPYTMPTPQEVARIEKLLLSTRRTEDVFASWSTMTGSMARLNRCVELFGDREKFLVTLDVVRCGSRRKREGQLWELRPQVFLHRNATHFDVFRALIVVHRADWLFDLLAGQGQVPVEELAQEDRLLAMLADSYAFSKEHTRELVNGLRKAGWDMGQFSYGSIQRRVEWPDRADPDHGSEVGAGAGVVVPSPTAGA